MFLVIRPHALSWAAVKAHYCDVMFYYRSHTSKITVVRGFLDCMLARLKRQLHARDEMDGYDVTVMIPVHTNTTWPETRFQPKGIIILKLAN